MGKPGNHPQHGGQVGLLQGPIWPIWRADLQVKFQVAGIPTHWKAGLWQFNWQRRIKWVCLKLGQPHI